MKMLLIARVVFLFGVAHSAATSKRVTPEYLDSLLAEGKYDELSYHLGIPHPSLARELPPSEREKNLHPRYNPMLKWGDMIENPRLAAEERQGVDFDWWGGSRWPADNDGIVRIPVILSANYTKEEVEQIFIGLVYYNNAVKKIRFVNYKSQTDYIYVFPGEGCHATVGRQGNQQTVTLGRYNDCFTKGTVAHEMNHAIGMNHEHNRLDRDNYIEVLWDNIPESWKSQFEKHDAALYKDFLSYDYFSLMHYPIRLPRTSHDAIRIKQEDLQNKSMIGKADDFTELDIRKIFMMYKWKYP